MRDTLAAPTIAALIALGSAGVGASAAPANDRSEHVASSSEQPASSRATPGRPGGFSVAELKALVPERIGAWKRIAFNVPLGEPVPGNGKTFESTFRQGGKQALLRVADMGEAALPTAKPWTDPPVESATETGSSKIYGERGHTVREEVDRQAKRNEVTLIFANGIVVSAESEKATLVELKRLAEGIDLVHAASMARPSR